MLNGSFSAGENRSSLADESVLTSRMRQSDMQSHLLSPRQPTRPGYFTGLLRRLKRKLGFKVKQREQYFEQEVSEAEYQLFQRRMELLDDPVYMCSLPAKQRTFQEFILKHSSVFPILPPEKLSMSLWNIVVMVVILYYFFEIGLVICFGQVVWQAELNAWWSYLFNFFAFLVLIADMVVSLNRGYYNQGILVLDRKKIYHHYLRYHSWIDLLGLIVVMMCFFSGNFTLNYFKVLFLLKLYNLYLIDVTFQRVLQFHRTRSTIYLVSRLVLLMVMSCHYLGGIFYAIDYYVYSTNYYGPNTPAWCWIYNAVAYSQMVLNLPWWLQYEYCMYWSLATMTTIAYGDITPLNPMETTYVIVMLIISCITFAYILNNIIEILLESKASDSNFQQEFVTMNQFMNEKLITEKLRVRIRSYFELIWNEERYRNREVEQEMIAKLPNELRSELLRTVYEKFLKELLFIQYFSQELLEKVVEAIYEYRTSNNEVIFESGSTINLRAYFLLKGKVTFFYSSNTLIDKLEYGSFGLCEFYQQKPRSLSARSNIDSLLYCLDWDTFDELVREDASSNETLRFVVESMRNGREAELLGMLCFICEESTHLCRDCPYSHFVLPMHIAVRRSLMVKQRRFKIRRRQKKDNNLFKSVNEVRREHQKYDRFARKQSVYFEAEELTTDESLNAQLGITDSFNNLDEYIHHTELLIRFLRGRLLNNSDYGDDTMQVDLKKNYEQYFPEFNTTSVIERFNGRIRAYRPVLF